MYDMILSKVKVKPKDEVMQISMCWKCSSCIQQTMVFAGKTGPEKSFELVGCKEMTQKEWEAGVVTEPFWNQTNCPLLKEDGNEEVSL